MHTIVGLGNPGDEYVHTRHNVGWLVLEALVVKHSFPSLTRSSAYSGMLGEGVLYGTEVGILLPTTFMNNSGVAVKKYIGEHGSLGTLVIVHDDIDLPFGEVRIGFDRGAGGHNGVKSIIDACGSKAFTRIRVGIAQKGFFGGVKRPKGEKLSNYVLGNFKSGELKQLPDIEERVARAIELIVTKGTESAMQDINGKE